MPTLAMPQNFEQDTAALLPDLIWDDILDQGDDPLLSALPFSYTESSAVQWDQYDNPYGLIPLRGVDASPTLVQMPGLRTYKAAPGFYGLVTQLRESELLFERQPNTIADPLEIADRLNKLVMDASTMIVSRFRQTAASLLVDGEFTNVNASGELHHHYQVEDYQTFSPANDGNTGPGWAADPANADPIGDLIYWQTKKLSRGTSADFGKQSKILCNPNVINDIWNCASVRERFKSKFGATILRGEMPNLDGDNSLNGLMIGMGLPPLVPYKRGYYETLELARLGNPDDYTYAIADQSLIWIGVRPKSQIMGAWKLTRNAGLVKPAVHYDTVSIEGEQKAEIAQGIYVRAHFVDRMSHHYDIEMGFNACPIIYYRRATAGISYT